MSLTANALYAPHIRHHENTRTVMGDVILVLVVLYIMAYMHYGLRAVALGVWSVAICVLADVAGTLMRRQRPHIRDLSAVVTGMLLPLMMPVSIPYRVVAVAAVVAVAVAKQPFGGVGHNVFNPAAAGFSFAAICFGVQMFTYPEPQQALVGAAGEEAVFLPVLGALDFVSGIAPTFTLRLGAVPQYELLDMAMGNYPGPMGATNILVILACLLYLVFRNTVRWDMPVAFFGAAFLFAYIFPRSQMDRLESVGYEMMSGLLLFAGVFLLGDPVTTPKRDLSKVAFGAVAGVVVMLFRRFGNMEESITFAILLMNATTWGFDMLGERVYGKIRRHRVEVFNSQKIQKKA